MKRLLSLAALVVALSPVQAAPLRVEAIPDKDYPIVPEAGTWMICAASFTGTEAPSLARQLVFQLRSKYNLAAYVFNRADEERARQKAELDRIRAQYPPDTPIRNRTIRVEEQCAVLVGSFGDFDAAAYYLPNIKKLPMPDLRLSTGEKAVDYVFQASRQEEIQSNRKEVNPFSKAMVIRNPTVPREPAPAAKFDPFWKKLNANEEFSLLKCNKPWTLTVKEYPGAAMLQSKIVVPKTESFWGKLWPSGSGGDMLNISAMQANELARVLRRFNFQAYVLHTRTSSIVTVGGFDSMDDPQMQIMRKQLATFQQVQIAKNRDHSDPLQMMPNPLPMEVPRQ